MNSDPEIEKIIKSMHGPKSCNRNYHCLTEDISEICTADECVWGDYLVCREKSPYCGMSLPFGYEYLCTCPVRIYIYKKYKK